MFRLGDKCYEPLSLTYFTYKCGLTPGFYRALTKTVKELQECLG
jgi:hypothetical protein